MKKILGVLFLFISIITNGQKILIPENVDSTRTSLCLKIAEGLMDFQKEMDFKPYFTTYTENNKKILLELKTELTDLKSNLAFILTKVENQQVYVIIFHEKTGLEKMVAKVFLKFEDTTDSSIDKIFAMGPSILNKPTEASKDSLTVPPPPPPPPIKHE